MKSFRRTPKLIQTVALILVSAAAGSALTGTALAVQGNMVNAKASLQSAISSLQAATPDKGGHREQAIDFARRALNQTNAGIAYANAHGG